MCKSYVIKDNITGERLETFLLGWTFNPQNSKKFSSNEEALKILRCLETVFLWNGEKVNFTVEEM